LFQTPLLAWNNYGHMTVAYIAYQKLTPQARDKVNALLTRNPDFQNWVAMVPAGTSAADKNLMLFMIAATWPDRIKTAAGYSEDNPSDPTSRTAPSRSRISASRIITATGVGTSLIRHSRRTTPRRCLPRRCRMRRNESNFFDRCWDRMTTT